MKRLGLYFFSGIALILIQTSVLPLFVGISLRPDLILLFVLYLGLNETPLAGAFYAWLLGCLLDVFCGMTLGLNGMIMLLIFCGTYMGGRQLNLENSLIMLLATIIGTISNSLLLIVTLLCFSEQSQSSLLIFNSLPTQLLVNLTTILALTFSFSVLRKHCKRNKRHVSQQGLQTWH